MSIIRKAHNNANPFAQISRKTLQDHELSWGARGLLAYLLSLPGDWRIRKTQLYRLCKNGKTLTCRIFQELIDRRYIKPIQLKDDKGQFYGWEYLVHECLPDEGENQQSENPQSGNQPEISTVSLVTDNPEIPIAEKRNSENVHLHNKISNKEDIYKEKYIKRKKHFLDSVELTEEEHTKLLNEYGEDTAQEMISRLNDYIMAKGKRYKSHYHTIRMWISKQPASQAKLPKEWAKEMLKNHPKPSFDVHFANEYVEIIPHNHWKSYTFPYNAPDFKEQITNFLRKSGLQ